MAWSTEMPLCSRCRRPVDGHFWGTMALGCAGPEPPALRCQRQGCHEVAVDMALGLCEEHAVLPPVSRRNHGQIWAATTRAKKPRNERNRKEKAATVP